VNLGMMLVLFYVMHPGTGFPTLQFAPTENDAITSKHLKRDEMLGPVEYEINIKEFL
jgi:hypothetical protein